MARDHVVMFPEIVEQGIKQKVQAMSPEERKWILEAMPPDEVSAQNEENRVRETRRIAAVLALNSQFAEEDRQLKYGG